jgi:hypothetical protein
VNEKKEERRKGTKRRAERGTRRKERREQDKPTFRTVGAAAGNKLIRCGRVPVVVVGCGIGESKRGRSRTGRRRQTVARETREA